MTQTPLKLKTYFSSTVEAAVDLARRELGSEAMLVNSRKTPDDVRHLGNYEVIFASATAPVEARKVQPVAHRHSGNDTERQLADIRNQLAGLRQSLSSPHAASHASLNSSESSILRGLLESNGVDPSICHELLNAVAQTHPELVAPEQLREALLAEMESRLVKAPAFHQEGKAKTVAALVGPPGRGKSTTLIKLAVTEGLARRIPVRILSIDNYRIGAREQMRSYASILGVPFHACDSVRDLDHHLLDSWCDEARKPSLTLIDTSGYGPHDIAEGASVAAYLTEHPEIIVHLVLRADAKFAEGVATVNRYADFGVTRLVFTGTDEAESYGSVYSVAAQSNKPVSFFGSGQSIPEDFEPVIRGRLAQLAMEGREAALLAA